MNYQFIMEKKNYGLYITKKNKNKKKKREIEKKKKKRKKKIIFVAFN